MSSNSKYVKKLKKESKKIGTWGHLFKARLDAIVKYADNQILDIGCSNGTYVRYLCQRGYDAYGCDLLPNKQWQGKFKKRFKVGNILALPYQDNSFDTVVAFEVLEHLSDVNSALREMFRISRKNVIISVPNCSQPPIFQQSGLAFHHWIDRTHKQFFTENSLKETLRRNKFRIVHFEYINPVIPEFLFLSGWHLPIMITKFIGQLANKIPFRKKYYMTLLVIASKNEKRK